MNENGIQKKKLHEMTDEELKKLSDIEIQELYMETLREFASTCSSIFKHIEQISSKKESAEQIGDYKTAEAFGTIEGFARDVIKDDLTKFTEIVSEITDDLKEKDGKTLSAFNNSQNREKAFVESISQPARIQQENIQARRDARYEELIDEAGEIESPMSRLGRR